MQWVIITEIESFDDARGCCDCVGRCESETNKEAASYSATAAPPKHVLVTDGDFHVQSR